MKQFQTILLAVLMLVSPVSSWAGGESQETEINGVTASIAYLRQYNGVLRLGIALKNSNKTEVKKDLIDYSEVVIIDPKANQKHYALKDADGHYLAGPVSDWLTGAGRWYVDLQPDSETLVWVLFDALAPGSKVTVQVPAPMQPFSNVTVAEGPPPADKEIGGSAPPLRLALLSAERATGQLNVRLKISNPGSSTVDSTYLAYKNVYAFDPQGKRKYPLLKDSEGLYLAQPKMNNELGGRWALSYVEPGGQKFMNLTFQAPPDSIRAVDIVIPWFSPLEAVAISGEGGASESGVAVAGKSLDLERAMKDLGAEVTPKEIKVNLSADVLFDFDKADLKPEGEPSLEKVATVLKANSGAQVTIEGHTDGKGTDAYNQPLSEKRAATVAQWFIAHNALTAANVHTKGWGKSKPIAPNMNPDGSDNPEGRAKNRRVEIVVNKQ